MSNKMKWTPGTWRAIKTMAGSNNMAIYEDDGSLIAKLGVLRSPATTRANAHLIAAAPELYDSLQYWLPAEEPLPTVTDAVGEKHREMWRVARAALAKAMGES